LILVTGGTGLVGTHLLYDLVRSGEKVRVLTRSDDAAAKVERVFSFYSASAPELIKNIEWRRADLLDIYSLLDAMKDVSQAYHCAAMVSFEKKHEREMLRTNVEGTANMVNAALESGVQKFLHVSSISALGKTEHGELITEETFWKASPDNSNYSLSKYSAEREVWRAMEEGLNAVVINPSLIIGPGNWQQSTCNMFSKGWEGIRFYTEGANGYVDVRDVSALAIRLMKSEHSSARYILNGENASFRDFFNIMHEAFGKAKPAIKAGKLASSFAWRAEKLKYYISGSAPLITPETARAAHLISKFSNEKISRAFPDHTFIKMEKSVKDTCEVFLREHRHSKP
jgi:dihydroflavonol-4-reductase